MKKTIQIVELIDMINQKLELNTINQDQKSGLCAALETILFKTDNYSGFHYLFDWNSMDRNKAESIQYNRRYVKSSKLMRIK